MMERVMLTMKKTIKLKNIDSYWYIQWNIILLYFI